MFHTVGRHHAQHICWYFIIISRKVSSAFFDKILTNKFVSILSKFPYFGNQIYYYSSTTLAVAFLGVPTRSFLLRFHPRPFSNHPHRIIHRHRHDAWVFRDAKVVKFDHFVTTVRGMWSMSRTMRSGTGSGQRGHFAAGEEVAVDAPKTDRLGGLLRCGLRDLRVTLHCQSSRERRSSLCCM